MVVQLILLISFILANPPVFGAVYKCVKPNGTRYYRDKFCDQDKDIQSELNCYNEPPAAVDNKKTNSDLMQYRRLLTKKRKQSQNKKTLAAKKYAVQQRQRLRVQQRCERIKQQIEHITQRQRTGYTVEQGIVLDRKLADYKNQRRKDCNNEQAN